MTASSAGEMETAVEAEDRDLFEELRLLDGRSTVAGWGWGGLVAAGRLVPLAESSTGPCRETIIDERS